MSDEKRTLFAIRHILMHQAKALGQACEAIEPCDHGAPQYDAEKLHKAARKFFGNAFRLARILNINANELVTKLLLLPE